MKFTKILSLTTCTLIPFTVATTTLKDTETSEETTEPSQISLAPKDKAVQFPPKSFLDGLCSCCSVQASLEEQALLVKPSEEAVRNLSSRIQDFETRVDDLGFFYYDLRQTTKQSRVVSIISRHTEELIGLDTRKQGIREGLQKIGNQEDFAELLQEWEEMEQELEEIENVIYTPYKVCERNMRAKRISDLNLCHKYLEEVMGRKDGEEANKLLKLKQDVQRKVERTMDSKDRTN